MRIGTPVMILLAVLFCTAAQAADLSGTWQADGKPQRVLKIHKAVTWLSGRLL